MKELQLPQIAFQTGSRSLLRVRRPALRKTLVDPLKHEDNGKGQKHQKNKRLRFLVKCVLVVVLIIAGVLVGCKPFFVNFFEEVNYFLNHLAKTTDWLLLKRRKRPNEKILYYVHISKTGGTSLMDAAYDSGLSVPIRNGLTQRDWRCCGEEDTMSAQIDYAKSSPFDFVACEGDMYDNMDTEHYDYVVTLRDSRARYKSMWTQWQKDPVMYLFNPMDFKAFADWFYEDNFMFRKICGSKCRGIPKYQIPREHFQYTLDRLEKFDSILFLENFGEGYAKFANKHGWAAPEQKKRIVGTHTSKEDEKEWNFNMSALDDALYEYARRVEAGTKPYNQFTRRTTENVDVYFYRVEGSQ